MANSPIESCTAATAGCVCKHVKLFLDVDFERQVLSGHVVLSTEVVDDGVTHLCLDTRDLTIEAVSDNNTGSVLEHTFDVVDEAKFGKGLRITLPAGAAKGQAIDVKVKYETSPSASGIQWLTPEQTAGKKHPFLFTQCQAIHARSLFPCQDTPAVKCPYEAVVTVPEALTALMSAIGTTSTTEAGKRTCTFEQKVPIPSYLTALVVGDLHSRKIGPRSHVWAEESVVEAAANEFAETEQMLATAETILTPYEWGKYDLLVLPPSFPYGGMENPCLTFVTPTLLAGDRSLANVVAHEIAHSWMGNLVTNKTWEDFWLNEGFTVYVERRIAARMESEQARHLHAIGGWKALMDSVEAFGADNPLTALRPVLKGVDPDDSFSSVPYEKGFNLLFHLETLLGGPQVMEDYLKAHVRKFAFGCVTTDGWKEFLYSHFSDKKDILDTVAWDAWFNKPGMPPVTPSFDTTLADRATGLADKWSSEADASVFASDDLAEFSSRQIVTFLDRLLLAERLMSTERLEHLGKVYGMQDRHNSEIRFRWQMLCLRHSWEPIFPHVVEFLLEQGRMKFVRPLYKALFKCEKAGDLAKTTFVKHRGIYHNICSSLVAKDLGVA